MSEAKQMKRVGELERLAIAEKRISEAARRRKKKKK